MKDHTNFQNSPSEQHNKTTFKSSLCEQHIKTKFRSSLFYAFRAGASPRLIVFAVILVMNLAFIIPGMFGVLPLAALITAVSLSGTAIGVMSVFNIIGDISIIRHMFYAPGAVLYALTPAPRKKTLLASVISMAVMDFITMAASITSVVILSLKLGSRFTTMDVWEMMNSYGEFGIGHALLSLALMIASYLLVMTLILFCVAVRKSVLYSKPAGGFLTFLLAVGILYAVSVSQLVLAPFATVARFYVFITVTVGSLGMGLYALLLLIFAAVLFTLTSHLFERKINI